MTGRVSHRQLITVVELVTEPPPVPGLRFRGYAGPTDLAPIVELGRAANLADEFDYMPTVADLSNEFEHADGLDLASDVVLAEVDGRIVGMGQVRYRARDNEHTYELSGSVHPDLRRRGIGRAILHASELRAQARSEELADDVPRSFASWGPDQAIGQGALLEAEGYDPIRYFFEMLKGDLGVPAPVALPEGLELRPVTRGDLRRVFEAENEAFRDHWGHHEWADEMFEEIAASPSLDLGLWRVAWAGDEVAGVVATYVLTEENELLGVSRGWLERISVRRPWRHRGVATALILAACEALHERGLAEAALGVDADNPSGALGLYESLGFAQHSRATSWRKPIPTIEPR
jgi:mycothiol synthase